MGFADKLMFWKKDKKDDFSDLGMGDIGKDTFGGSDPFAQQGAAPDADALGSPFGGTSGSDSFSTPAGFADRGVQPAQQPQQGMNSFSQQSQQSSFSGPSPSQPYAVSPSSTHASSDEDRHTTYITNKNLEILSSKLDALRAAIDSMSQRLENIERIAYGEQEKKRYKEW